MSRNYNDFYEIEKELCHFRTIYLGKKLMKGYTSKYKGVYWSKCAKKWVAQVTTDGHKFYLGLFNREESAAKAYDVVALVHHGEFARINFERSNYE